MDDVDIDPRILRNIFEDFKRSIEKEMENNGEIPDFSSFSNIITSSEEGYKTVVFGKGQTILQFMDWKEDLIGTGYILDVFIKSYGGKDNNLVDWRSLNELNKVKNSKTKTEKVERLVFNLYKNRNVPPAQIFDSLKPFIKRYDAVAYPFFLKDMNQYVPVKPQHFDKFFKKVGSNFRTWGRCSWENYQQYLNHIKWIKNWLEDEGIDKVSLIDAHSFCWMAVNWLEAHPFTPLSLPVSKKLNIDSSRIPEVQNKNEKFNSDGSENKSDDEFDPADWDKRKRELGNAAEKWVEDSEIERLRKLGHPNPKKAVKNVSRERRLGYDIKSCEKDGTPRYIEVKTIQRRREFITFHISKNELLQAKFLQNYWIYCVLNPDSNTPEVRHFHIRDLNEEWLSPTSFFAKVPIKDF